MVGTGDPITYGRAGVQGSLAVGLWAHPAVLDFDGDGNLDIILSSISGSYNGIFLFRNLGTNAKPLFDRAEWLGKGKAGMVAADFNGDGAIDLVAGGGYFSDVRRNRLSAWVPVQASAQLLDRPRRLLVPDRLGWRRQDRRAGRRERLARLRLGRRLQRKGRMDARAPARLRLLPPQHRQQRRAEVCRPRAGGSRRQTHRSVRQSGAESGGLAGRGKLDLVATDFIDTITLFRNRGTRRPRAWTPGNCCAPAAGRCTWISA